MRIPEYMMKKGKLFRQKAWTEASDESLRKSDVSELIDALVDAASSIGSDEGTGEFSQVSEDGQLIKPFSHLFPRHLVALMPDHMKKKEVYATMEETHQNSEFSKGKSSNARIPVYWPTESLSANEYRKAPMQITGLLMRRMIDGDAAFFDEIAKQIRNRKKTAKQAPDAKRGQKKVGKIIAKTPRMMGMGDPDWFTRMSVPPRNGKVPHAIWAFCRDRHKRGMAPPTRRDIRQKLAAKGMEDKNLRVTLSRMNLNWLEEGTRNKRSI